MSVPVNQREPGKLAACMKAHDLCVYTLRIVSNSKNFASEYDSFKRKIEDVALSIHEKAWMANNVKVSDKNSYDYRIGLQTESLTNCYALLSYIDIAKNLYHLDTKRVKYWGGMVIETKNLIRAWRDSDKKRYAPQIGM